MGDRRKVSQKMNGELSSLWMSDKKKGKMDGRIIYIKFVNSPII